MSAVITYLSCDVLPTSIPFCLRQKKQPLFDFALVGEVVSHGTTAGVVNFWNVVVVEKYPEKMKSLKCYAWLVLLVRAWGVNIGLYRSSINLRL